MVKVKEKAWSVAGQKIRDRIKPEMPQAMKDQLEQQAADQSLADVYGADWRERVNPDGTIAENGIGSTWWLTHTATDAQAERHYAAIGRFVGPAAERAERERIARLLKGRK
jgi:hypothetical protein